MAYKQILDKPNVLVAGGAGFIGSHLCDALLSSANVICVDNFITGREENIDLLLQKSNFEFIKHDLRETLDLESLPEIERFKVKYQGIQKIFNLACPTSPKEYYQFPLETLQANAYATENLLALAVKYGAKFIHTSTSAIYGEPGDHQPFKEDYWGFINPVGERSCYNEGKRFAESLVVNYGRQRKVDWKIARIFNTYGPRLKVNDGRLIPDFVMKALLNEPLIIYGSLKSLATFCYVSDIVEGLIKLSETEVTGIFNLGNTEPHEIGEVANKIIALTNSHSQIQVDSQIPSYIVKQGVPDITKARELLGWFPLVSFTQGLQWTIDYLKAHRNILGLEAKL